MGLALPALLRTAAVVDQIRSFRQSANFDPFSDAFIETLCVRSAAVMCVAEIEQLIADRLRSRIRAEADGKVAFFITNNLASLIKRTSKSDISKTVKLFGSEPGQAFDAMIPDQDVTAYGNLLAGRHEIAHAEGGSLSFDELETGIEVAERMLRAFDQCIQ